MWLYAGFLSLGSLAGELREPVRRSYVVALLILIPMVLLVNCMPPLARWMSTGPISYSTGSRRCVRDRMIETKQS